MSETEPRSILSSALVWDNVWPVDQKGGPRIGNDWSKLERFRRAGYDVIGLTLAGDNQNISQAIEMVGWARRAIRERAESCVLVDKLEDIEAARRAGKLAVVFQFEGTRCFERNLDMIEVFYALGVRQTILVFNNANSVGGGCADPVDGGLTPFGARLVSEMQAVGMLVDLSHTGCRTSLDAMAMAQKPMIFSHSNPRRVHDSFRNVTDEQIRACAATGGLIGISGASAYLGDETCATATLFKHLDYLVQMVGPEHVGIGLDTVFDPTELNAYCRARPDEWPMTRDPNWSGFNYALPEQLVELTDLMARNGYPESAIRQILGENYVRIARQVWA